jgi:hypothetical protein
MTEMEKTVGRALTLIHTSGLKDFGRYPKGNAGALQELAKVYTVAISDDKNINREIVEMTAKRYLTRKVWIWENGSHNSPTEFPTSSQFADACKQTFLEEFAIRPIGELTVNGCPLLVSVVVPRAIPGTAFKALAMQKRKELGIQEALEAKNSRSIHDAIAMVHKTFGIEGDPEEIVNKLRKQA